ncbi:MAG: peptidylprolyl isomerase [bacterium]|nr:peptidylprolyl isomerase [bacterium]
MKKLFLVLLIGLFIMPFMSHAQETDRQTPDDICASAIPAPEPTTREYTQPEQVLEAGVDYSAVFCTEAGAVYVDLFETLAPKTVNSFVFLAQNGYYNNTTFHRVLADFMAQGGDPTGTGSGGPGYTVLDEYVAFMTFDRPGLLATANANNRDQGITDTNGSQFFITTVVTDWLNYNHSIFGEVLTGQDIVNGLPLRDPSTATVPGPALNTVVIVTDPNTVISGYEAPVPATEADFEAIITAFEPLDGVEIDPALTGVFTSEATVASFPEAVQADVTALLTDNNFLFSASVRHVNPTCDTSQLPLTSVRELILVFASKEDAVTAQNSETFVSSLVTEANADVTESASNYYGLPIYSWNVTACDVPAVQSRMVRQLGRMLIITENVSPVDSPVVIEEWFDQLVSSLYDAVFAPVFRPEVNQ